MNYKNLSIVLAIVAVVFIGVSVYAVVTYPAPAAPLTIDGAGSTFVAPLYTEWASAYKNITGVQISYTGIGSGAGVNDFYAKVVDFGASDPPLSSTQYANFTTAGLMPLHIPTAIGGVTIPYNIPGITAHLNFTAYLLAQIFNGNITYWDNINITSLNPGVTLPHQAIVICHRSDSSGTTKIFSTYLANSGTGNYGTFKLAPGSIVSWPTNSLGGSGSSGVASLIGHNSYSIGYVELQYALGSNLTYGRLENPSGNFILPSLASLTSTVNAVGAVLPTNGSSSFASVGLYLNLVGYTGGNASAGYPITSFTYIIVSRDLHVVPDMTLAKALALRSFLLWAVNQGQAYSPGLSYVPLPASVVALDDATIGSIYYS
jgi:phosphate ABC transporter phosphate-binding protein